MWRRAVESSSRYTKVDGDFSAENSGNGCYVVEKPILKGNNGIMQWMKVGQWLSP